MASIKKNTIIQETSMKELKEKKGYELQREVIELNRSSQVSILEIGKRLIILKETSLKSKEFRRFIEEDVRIGYDIANKYMKIVRRYAIDEDNTENAKIVIELGVKKADKLLRIADLQERMNYIKEMDLLNKSFKEVSDLLDRDYPTQIKTIRTAPWTQMQDVQLSIQNQIENMNKVNETIREYEKFTRDVKVKRSNNHSVTITEELNVVQTELNRLLSKIATINTALEEVKNRQQNEEEVAATV